MKKKFTHIIYGLSLTLAAVLASGCEKFLTRDAENQTTEDDWWTSKTMLETVLKQCYNPVPGGTIVYSAMDKSQEGTPANAYANNSVEMMEGITDNGVTCANYIDNSPFTYSTVSSTKDVVVRTWTMNWAVIRRCCRFLENWNKAQYDIDKNPHEGIQTVDRWVSEVRALRAYYHMRNYMLYGEIPIVDKVVSPEEQDLETQPKDKIVSWIASELEEASKNLPLYPQVQTERWRWTKGACYSYISYIYMYDGNWAKAKEWAQKVIDLGIYDIYTHNANPAASYSEQFLYDAYTNNTKEVIWTKDKGAGQATFRLSPTGTISGGSGIAPTAALLDAYELKDGRTLDELTPEEREKYHINPTPADRDPRMSMTIFFPDEKFLGYTPAGVFSNGIDAIGKRNSTKTGYWIKKWVNSNDYKSSNANGTLPFAHMRYAVVLLNYVEAAIELGELDDENIYTYLDKIRTRAGHVKVDRKKYDTQEELRELVRRERRIELAFEGHRIFDIRRWRIGEEVMNGPVYGAKYPDKDELYFVEERRFNPDRDYVWPIPAAEILANGNLDQNPGY